MNNQKGTTLVELVLFIVLSAITVGVTSHIMTNQLDAYSFISNRQATLSDARYAFNRTANELIYLETADITAIGNSQIDFVDQNSLNVNLRSGASAIQAGQLAMYRGDEILIDPVNSLTFSYFDQNGIPTVDIAAVRQIELTVTTQPLGNEGSLSLSTRIIPRNFVYENYQ